MTLVPTEEARGLVQGFEVEDASGGSRLYIDQVGQLWAVAPLVLRSLAIMQTKTEEFAGADVAGGD